MPKKTTKQTKFTPSARQRWNKFNCKTKTMGFVFPINVTRKEVQSLLDNSKLFEPHLLDKWKDKKLKKR